jgi:tetratricopeptide (TPR) repeat protein
VNIEEIRKKIEAASGTEKVDLLNELGAWLQESDPVAAGEYAQSAIELAIELGYEKGIAGSHLILGFTSWIKGDYEPAMKHYDDALAIFEKIDDKQGIADSYRKTGISYCGQLDYDQAMDCHLKAIEICEEIDDKEAIASNYSDVSFIHWKRNDFDQTLKYLQLALETFEEVGNSHKTATTLNNIGATYEKLEEYDKALDYYLGALEIWEKAGDTQNANIAHTYNNIGIIYTQKDEYEKSLEYLLKAQAIWEAMESKGGLAMVYINMSDLFIKTADYERADELLQKALEISRQINDLEKELECYSGLQELYAAQSDYEHAFKYNKEYTSLREKLFNAEMNQRVTEMQTRYESEKNRRDAEIYRLKNVELAEEISVRKRVETELSKYKDHLEEMVDERTAELEKEIVERKKTEQALDERLRFERLISHISTFFITVKAGEIEKGIEENLKLIGEFFNVDMSSFAQVIDRDRGLDRFLWLSDNYDQELKKYVYHLEFPNLENYMEKNESLIFDSTENALDQFGNWAEEQFFLSKVGQKAGVIMRLSIGGRFAGIITLGTIGENRDWSEGDINRLKILGEILVNAVSRKQSEEILQSTAKELRQERKVLTEKNIALNEVLQHIENQKVDERRKILRELEKALIPQVKELKKASGQPGTREMESLEMTLNAVLGKDSDDFDDCYANLTSRESEICRLIKKGMTSKQIADNLSLSLLTVYKYRERIRKKLKIQNKNVNLATYLRSH